MFLRAVPAGHFTELDEPPAIFDKSATPPKVGVKKVFKDQDSGLKHAPAFLIAFFGLQHKKEVQALA